jgi:exonuclease III
MSLVLRGSWSNIIVLNAHEPSEEKNDDSKDSFYEELEKVFDNFRKCHTKILLGDINANVERGDIFKPTIEYEILQHDSNGNGVRIVHFAASST